MNWTDFAEDVQRKALEGVRTEFTSTFEAVRCPTHPDTRVSVKWDGSRANLHMPCECKELMDQLNALPKAISTEAGATAIAFGIRDALVDKHREAFNAAVVGSPKNYGH